MVSFLAVFEKFSRPKVSFWKRENFNFFWKIDLKMLVSKPEFNIRVVTLLKNLGYIVLSVI